MAKAKTKIFVEEPDLQQKFFRLPNWFNKPLWLEKADRIGEHAKDLDRTTRYADKWNDLLPWDIGDWLLEGEAGKVPMKELRQVAAQKFPEIYARHAWKTFRNWKVTARAIEPSRRRDGRGGSPFLSYSVHQVVEKYNPELQDIFLQEAVAKGLTRNGLKDVIKEKWQRMADPLFDKRPRNAVTMRLSSENYEILKSVALAKGFTRKRRRSDNAKYLEDIYNFHHGKGPKPEYSLPDVARLVLWMVSEYIKEHKAELNATLKQAKS